MIKNRFPPAVSGLSPHFSPDHGAGPQRYLRRVAWDRGKSARFGFGVSSNRLAKPSSDPGDRWAAWLRLAEAAFWASLQIVTTAPWAQAGLFETASTIRTNLRHRSHSERERTSIRRRNAVLASPLNPGLRPGDYLLENPIPRQCCGLGESGSAGGDIPGAEVISHPRTGATLGCRESGEAAVGVGDPAKRRLQVFLIKQRSCGFV